MEIYSNEKEADKMIMTPDEEWAGIVHEGTVILIGENEYEN